MHIRAQRTADREGSHQAEARLVSPSLKRSTAKTQVLSSRYVTPSLVSNTDAAMRPASETPRKRKNKERRYRSRFRAPDLSPLCVASAVSNGGACVGALPLLSGLPPWPGPCGDRRRLSEYFRPPRSHYFSLPLQTARPELEKDSPPESKHFFFFPSSTTPPTVVTSQSESPQFGLSPLSPLSDSLPSQWLPFRFPRSMRPPRRCLALLSTRDSPSPVPSAAPSPTVVLPPSMCTFSLLWALSRLQLLSWRPGYRRAWILSGLDTAGPGYCPATVAQSGPCERKLIRHD